LIITDMVAAFGIFSLTGIRIFSYNLYIFNKHIDSAANNIINVFS